MKVVALISGGKDSTYNMLHCVVNGHEIIAMANLHPPSTAQSDEMDSFMYQTVGHTALDYYSACMGGIPMYRGEIKGTSTVQSLEYKPDSNDDETEDLLRLLQRVQQDHPDVEGVSVGAILSTYQRTRVESVCARLGLTSLAYLWERSQAELLDEIIAGGVDARIIKTAAYGLGRKHLGRSLSEIRDELVKMNSMFGLHLCGEGGEYETLVFDSPLFEKKLVSGRQEVVGSPHDDVWHLTLSEFTAEEKTVEEGPFGVDKFEEWKDMIKVPSLLEDEFESLLDDIKLFDVADTKEVNHTSFRYTAPQDNTSLAVYNLTAPASYRDSPIETEAAALFKAVTEFMTSHGIQSSSQLTFSSLVLSSMSHFQTINSIYSKHFLEPIPPARVCIESRSIINDMRIQLSLTYTTAPTKTGLHVQGRSYWAPANIGPYSQATCADGVVYLAGQIPLVPASMDLYSNLSYDDVAKSSVLSLQHITRVMRAVVPATSESPESMFAYIAAIVNGKAAGEIARRTWNLYNPNSTDNKSPMLVIQVSGLPRGASVEWAGLGIDHSTLAAYDSDDSECEEEDGPEFYKAVSYKQFPNARTCWFGTQVVAIYTIRSGSPSGSSLFETQQDFVSALGDVKRDMTHLTGTMYVTLTGVEKAKVWAKAFKNQVEIIMVDEITSSEGDNLELAFIMRGRWI